jgi:hypothetical protein
MHRSSENARAIITMSNVFQIVIVGVCAVHLFLLGSGVISVQTAIVGIANNSLYFQLNKLHKNPLFPEVQIRTLIAGIGKTLSNMTLCGLCS